MKIIMDPRRFVSAALLVSALVSSACLGGVIPKPATPAPPSAPEVVIIEGRDAEFAATCAAVYQSELGRAIDESGAADCLDRCRRGATGADLAAWLRSSEEYADRQEQLARAAKEAEERRQREEQEREARAKLRGRLRVDGQRIVDASGQPFVEPFASALTLLTKSSAERAVVLDELATLGFRGIRVFAGRLTWAGQSPASALDVLPAVLEEARARKMYVLVTAVTDSRDGGYDELAHVSAVAVITAGAEHAVLEASNESYHPSQSDRVNNMSGWCAEVWAALIGYPNLWALGAAPADYPTSGRYAGMCGPASTSHLERHSPEGMLERVVGLAQIARVTQRPVLSSEPIGAGEVTKPGSRLADPAFFGELARRQASLGIVGVFHSEDGLFARPLGPVQRAAAQAFVAGYYAPPIVIPVPEPFSCSQALGPLEIVRCQRAARGRMSHEEIAAFLRDVVRDLNTAGVDGGPFGLLVKPGGTNCVGFSCDAICSGQGSTQRQWDVLTDIENAQAPSWSEIGTKVVRPCEAVPSENAPARAPWTPAIEGSAGTYPIPPIVGMTGNRK